MERFSAAAWPDAEEIRVVSELDGSFLTSNVNTDGQALPVGVPGLQLGALTMLQVFLIEQAEGSILQRKKEIVVRVETIGIAREAVEVELQLVIGTLRRHDATLVELRLYIRGNTVELVLRTADHDIEVRVHQQLAVDGELV